MRIVAIRAGHDAFIDPVLERHVELRAHRTHDSRSKDSICFLASRDLVLTDR